jgi:hypothetical protein
MNADADIVPTNIWRFELLLYASLLLDTLMAAFTRLPDDFSEGASTFANLLNLALIAAFLWLVNLAARRRQRWARTVLLVVLALSVATLPGQLADGGNEFGVLINVVSTALTAAGLYFAFTGDAREWFARDRA